ncbi:MAG: PRC-barrel domain-containing protein [Ginsengibacter sp.]
MKRSIKSLTGFSLKETDGELGKVDDFYFDDSSWIIRYMVVETGSWFSEKKVLLSPSVIKQPDWENEQFVVALTQDQIKNSPNVDTDKPVSRQQEEQLSAYYTWDVYWGNQPHGGGIFGAMPSDLYAGEMSAEPETVNEEVPEPEGDKHLRSTKEIEDYKIHTTDGEIGKVVDYIIDDSNWKITYLIVETGSWLNSKKVLLSTSWITDVKWDNKIVIVNTTTDEVKDSPDFDESQPLNDDYERNLNNYYANLKK